MNFRRPSETETVAEARRLLSEGQSDGAVVTSLRVRWNLDTKEAERLVRSVKSQPATAVVTRETTQDGREAGGLRRFRVPWGAVFFLVGLFVALAADFFEGTGVGGPLVVALFAYVFWSYWKQIYAGGRWLRRVLFSGDRSEPSRADLQRSQTSDASDFMKRNRTILVLSGVAAVLVVLFFIGLFSTTDSISFTDPFSELTPPDESAVTWTEEPVEDVGSDTYRFEGRIVNTDDSWSMIDPVVVTKLFNDSGVLVGERRTELIIRRVGPGQSRFYSVDVRVFERFDFMESELEWSWER